MKFVVALCLFYSSAYAGHFVEFECSSPSVSYIFKLQAAGSVEIDVQSVEYSEAFGWVDATLVDAGFNQATSTINDIELAGKSRLIERDTLKPYYHVQLKTVGLSDVATANLLLGHPGQLSSVIRLKDGREYRGKCTIK